MISAFKDIVAKLHPRYTIELSLISLAFVIFVFSMTSYLKSPNSKTPQVLSAVDSIDSQEVTDIPVSSSSRIYIDVSGAVANPDVFEVTPGARLKDMIELAGGMTDMADKNYVYRNYNLAKFVGDQEKIYIPYFWDITNGTFVEEKRVLEYLQPLYPSNSVPLQSLGEGGLNSLASPKPQAEAGPTISLNSASSEELDTLPGVGPVTAQKIIDSRPYSTIEELLSKKVVNQSTYDKLKNFIDL